MHFAALLPVTPVTSREFLWKSSTSLSNRVLLSLILDLALHHYTACSVVILLQVQSWFYCRFSFESHSISKHVFFCKSLVFILPGISLLPHVWFLTFFLLLHILYSVEMIDTRGLDVITEVYQNCVLRRLKIRSPSRMRVEKSKQREQQKEKNTRGLPVVLEEGLLA